MTFRSNRALKVPTPARVEGAGAISVRVDRGTVTDVKLEIYEPPRSFEAFLSGRAHTDPPDITASICGICPVAYQISACSAVEDACGVGVGEPTIDLRRLLSCGEWIASHALHIYLMHAPDFLGYDGVIGFARDHPDLVERGLSLKKVGNALVELISGPTMQPTKVHIGGFARAPSGTQLRALAGGSLRRALDDAVATAEWVAGFDFPTFVHGHELLALVHPGQYPIEAGVPHTSSGLAFPAAAFPEHLPEDPTTANVLLTGDRTYITGPAARYALNADRLSPLATEMAATAALPSTYRNPYRSIAIRAVEMVYAVEEALRLIEAYEPQVPSSIEVPPRAGTGTGVAEAPRGTLFQQYTLTPDGTIASARILPPTAQNQAGIEDDVHRLVQDRLDLEDRALAHECERAIRNYDPCISCAPHVLALKVVRS
ncbi:MAG: Ni/Fe hydrogenase subunit alpha [Dactylosporangium sp.]|nr:nickel-dependent hydrogenase large subunit [Dactylosporangium sp.]NNJ62216.1 Ni/Fe hydrogenase subunit alpha [Dactylosporangium sp.]